MLRRVAAVVGVPLLRATPGGPGKSPPNPPSSCPLPTESPGRPRRALSPAAVRRQSRAEPRQAPGGGR